MTHLQQLQDKNKKTKSYVGSDTTHALDNDRRHIVATFSDTSILFPHELFHRGSSQDSSWLENIL